MMKNLARNVQKAKKAIHLFKGEKKKKKEPSLTRREGKLPLQKRNGTNHSNFILSHHDLMRMEELHCVPSRR